MYNNMNNSNDYNNTPQYNNVNNNNNYNGNGYNNAQYTNYNENNNKMKKKYVKFISAIAIILVIAVAGGAAGSAITYIVMKDKITASGGSNSSNAYVAPEFTSSTDGSLTVSEAFEKVKPAVVTIYTKTASNGFSSGSEGMGSGFIINEDGYVVTNYHVIDGSSDITVQLSNGTEVSASVVNYNQEKDIAMIKLAEGTEIPGVAELGDSDAIYAGQDVIAIGTPLYSDLSQTLTKGIVSSPQRALSSSDGTSIDVIQTDAAINPGNSGGPLVNTQGQVIGINSSKISEVSGTGSSVEGIGFAIPINEVKDRMDTLSKPILTLGITVVQFDDAAAKKYNTVAGLYVKAVNSGSPAESAGVKVGDVIIEANGTKITTNAQLSDVKSKLNSGDRLELVVERNGKQEKLSVTLG